MTSTMTTPEQVLHEVAAAATGHCWCSLCGADPGTPCRDAGGGTHLRRAVAARMAGKITATDFGDVCHQLGVFTDTTIIPNRTPEETS